MNPIIPRDLLFTTWEGGGNVPPFLGVARRLAERGHRVRVMLDACDRVEVERAGVTFVPWTTAPSRPDKTRESDVLRDHEGETPADVIRLLLERIMSGPALHYANDVRVELARRPADALVTSEMLPGAMIGAESMGVPFAILTSNISLFPIPGIPPFGPGFFPPRSEDERALQATVAEESRRAVDAMVPALAALRTRLGLAPIDTFAAQLARADRILLGTSPAFDFPASSLPERTRYVGPGLDDPQWLEEWASPWPQGDRRPLVLVAFSTTDQRQDEVLVRVVEALGGLPVRAVVTLGPALARLEVPAPANVALVAHAPHSRILESAAAVVTHAGHGTVMRGLAGGVPLLCLPMGRDQNDNAARVVARGAGLSLPPTASAGVIRESLRRLIDEPIFRHSARELGARIAADAANGTAVAEIEAMTLPLPASLGAGARSYVEELQ